VRALLRSGLAAALLAALYTVAGCNAVLGIEQAELEQTSAPVLSCDWPIADPTVDCPPGTCDDQCHTHCDVGACLADQGCRQALQRYRKCAGDACKDDGVRCGSCVSKSPLATELSACLSKDYRLPVTAAASLCESYCACMHDRCSDNALLLDVDMPDTTSCIEACSKGGSLDPKAYGFWKKGKPLPSEIYCLWTHCEAAAQTNDKFHCEHALGQDFANKCPPKQLIDPNAASCEYPKGYGNAPCNSDDDCCGTCRTGQGVCTAQ
jgi:hypothetical protein